MNQIIIKNSKLINWKEIQSQIEALQLQGSKSPYSGLYVFPVNTRGANVLYDIWKVVNFMHKIKSPKYGINQISYPRKQFGNISY